jgi:hypothetical protein
MAEIETSRPVTALLRTFCSPGVADMPENKARDLIRTGEIESVLIGRNRYVIMESFYAYLERQKAIQAGPDAEVHRTANRPPPPKRNMGRRQDPGSNDGPTYPEAA